MAVIIRPIRHLAGYRKYDVGRRTFLTNLLKSLQSTNPLLEIIDRICRQEETSIENDNKAALKTLQWKDVQPQHVASASKTLKERLDSQMDQIIMSKNQQIASQDIQKTLTSLDQAFAPSKTLQYAITLLSVVKDKEWTSFIDYVPTRRLETQLIDNIETAAQKTDDTEARRAADHLVSGDIDLLEPASDAHTRRDDLRDALGQFSVELVSASPNLSNSTIGNMYQWLGIRTELAKLSGHKCVVDQVFPHRMASLQQIQELHLRVRDRVLPHVYDPQETPDSDLVDLLGMSGTPMGASSGRRADDPKRMDEKTMLRLERHVTLDGALVFCFRLCGELFGVEVVEESLSPGQLWDKDARLFHVHDRNNQSYIGSFYLDPFQRGGKFRRPVTVPVVPRGLNQCPVLCMSLTIQSPTWDTDPAALSWEDAEALLHEFGHVIDFLLSPNAYGSIAGPVETLPFDRSELLPKFMELWMMEKSTLYSMMDASKSQAGFSDDEIDAAFRVRSRRKCLELAQLAFYGSLELYLFSEFDIRGDESLVALQSRWASEYSPHDKPHEKSIGPLLEIFKESAAGRNVAYYRYLWCEALGAELFEQLREQHNKEQPAAHPQEMHERCRQLLLTSGTSEWTSGNALFAKYNIL